MTSNVDDGKERYCSDQKPLHGKPSRRRIAGNAVAVPFGPANSFEAIVPICCNGGKDRKKIDRLPYRANHQESKGYDRLCALTTKVDDLLSMGKDILLELKRPCLSRPAIPKRQQQVFFYGT
jgi:hypothetical protein